jgi:putative MATE family efflux protein
MPSVIDAALQSATMLIQAYWMGYVGGVALAAVTMGTTLRIVLISPMMGLSAGGLAVVARHVGAKENRQADLAVMQSILLIACFVLPLAIIGLTLGRTLLGWMGASGAMLAESMAFARIIFFGLFFMETLPSLNGILRGAGHPEYTLYANLTSAITLILAVPAFSLGWVGLPAMGVRGAALASVISSAIGVATQLAILLTGKVGLHLHLADLVPNPRMMWRILRIALPTSAERLSPNLAAAFLMRLVANQGDLMLMAYALASRIAGFFWTPSMGMSFATAALVGQNLGAHKPDRAGEAVRLSVTWAVLITAVLFAIANLAPRPVLSAFERSPEVVDAAILGMRFYAISSLGLCVATIVGRGMSGAGDTVSPMLVSIGALWLVQLPLVWLLAGPAGLGALGIWIGLTAANLISAVAMVHFFRQGRWRSLRI